MEGGEAAYLNINIKKRAAAARPIDTLQPLGISTRHRIVTRSRGLMRAAGFTPANAI